MSFQQFMLRKERDYCYLPKEGTYPATIENGVINDKRFYDVTEEIEYPSATITFKLANGKCLKPWFLLKLVEFSPIDMLLKAAFGEVEKINNLDDLIGKEVLIEIKHEPGKDGTGMYARVKKILPIEVEEDFSEEETQESLEEFEDEDPEISTEDEEAESEQEEDIFDSDLSDSEDEFEEPEESPKPVPVQQGGFSQRRKRNINLSGKRY